MKFFLLPSLLSVFSSRDEINIKDTDKSLITSALSTFTKNNKLIGNSAEHAKKLMKNRTTIVDSVDLRAVL